jgi:hypothetical protein
MFLSYSRASSSSVWRCTLPPWIRCLGSQGFHARTRAANGLLVRLVILLLGVLASPLNGQANGKHLAATVTLPDVDTTILSAFGLGQGAYLAKKALGTSTPNTPAKVAAVE